MKNGPRRLFVPNSTFLTREFMVSAACFSSDPCKMEMGGVCEAKYVEACWS